jgi:nucleotide-binding universal stress UspA family protein
VKPDVAERLGDPCVNLAPIEEEAATALFEEAKIRIAELGLEAEARILRGDPIRLIAAQARRFSADLVVVGHRRKGFLERWWSDLTEASLADQLTCTVLVARREISDEEFRSLVAEG